MELATVIRTDLAIFDPQPHVVSMVDAQHARLVSRQGTKRAHIGPLASLSAQDSGHMRGTSRSISRFRNPEIATTVDGDRLDICSVLERRGVHIRKASLLLLR